MADCEDITRDFVNPLQPKPLHRKKFELFRQRRLPDNLFEEKTKWRVRIDEMLAAESKKAESKVLCEMDHHRPR